MPKNIRRLQAQLRSASSRSSKIVKDADSIEAVVEVMGRSGMAEPGPIGANYTGSCIWTSENSPSTHSGE